MTCRNKLILSVGILGFLSGIAGIVLIVLDLPKIGAGLSLGWMPAGIACIEWRCRDPPSRRTQSPLRGLSDLPHMRQGADKTGSGNSGFMGSEALPTPLDIRINIPPNSPGGK
jgi:hypothetical protein